MKKSVKFLFELNLLNYANNFLFSFTYTYANKNLREQWLVFGLWVLSPYVFVTITSFILATDNKEEYKIFKKEAIADWIIRAVSCGACFQEFNFTFLSSGYILQQIILVILLMVNIILEYKMYKKAKKYVPIKNHNEGIEKISEAEKQNIKNMGKATTLGVVSLVVFAFSLGFPNTYTDGLFRMFLYALSISCFGWFIYTNYKKCNLFYLDKTFGKRIFVRDILYATIGFIINFIVAFGLMKATNIIQAASVGIAILSLYPTIRTNRKMALRYRKIVKILGDNFYLYFTCNDKKRC